MPIKNNTLSNNTFSYAVNLKTGRIFTKHAESLCIQIMPMFQVSKKAFEAKIPLQNERISIHGKKIWEFFKLGR